MIAFKKGFMEAMPVLLQPMALLTVTIPDKFTGDVMGDLNKRHGRVVGMTPDKNNIQIIEAEIPMSDLYGYSTGGLGEFEYVLSRYEQAPVDVQEKEVRERSEANNK